MRGGTVAVELVGSLAAGRLAGRKMSGSRSVCVVGAGILGLAVARELTMRFPGVEVTVLEKEDHVAAHQTGHNSGVVHAGVYYPPGSLKATLCRRGAALTREFCQQHDVPLRELGKLIVAARDTELDGLAEIERRATANQVPGLRRLAAGQIAEIEPCIEGVAALHSPHTAAVDFVGMTAALADEVTAAGGKVVLSTPVTGHPRDGGRRAAASRRRGASLRLRDRVRRADGATSSPADLGPGRRPADRALSRRVLRAAAAGARTRCAAWSTRYPTRATRSSASISPGTSTTRVHVGPNAVLALALCRATAGVMSAWPT